MNNPKISLIAAIGEKRELGKDNKLLWHIPEDLKRFRRLTSGHVVIMGRKTYESIGRLLPNRTNIIITRDANYKVEGAIIVHSLENAIAKAKEIENKEVFIIGGGQIFDTAIAKADKLYLTVIHATSDADVFFPDYSAFKKIIFKEDGEFNHGKFTYLNLEK